MALKRDFSFFVVPCFVPSHKFSPPTAHPRASLPTSLLIPSRITMAGLLRYQLFLSIGVVFLAIWKMALTNLTSIKSFFASNSINQQQQRILSLSSIELFIVWLPLWAVLLLGIYALISVLYRVVTFGDCPDAAVELSGQIEEAKSRLKERGFQF